MADETTLPDKRPVQLVIEEPPHGGFIVQQSDYVYGRTAQVVAAFSTLDEMLKWISRVFRTVE
ncbi:hypothetical protein AB0L20_32360 [Streptomyces albidoflavus]|uniref:hypothetical protein n=1 Tax=Streptomyces albidoflavus TaxID=1886 RepID=UPI0034450B81